MFNINYYLFSFVLLICSTFWPPLLSAQSTKLKVTYIPYSEASFVLTSLHDILPPELKAKDSSERPAFWSEWVTGRDREIRGRLIRGDEDSLINFLLFGTSYTKEPRITARQIEQLQGQENLSSAKTPPEKAQLKNILQSRISDFLHSLRSPGNNERLIFARKLIAQKGFQPGAVAGKTKIRNYLLESLTRVLGEQVNHARILEVARLQGDANNEFIERSKLYRTRGLSSDSSLSPGFAIEESLKEIQSRGLLGKKSVRQVAIIGPGLDFTDKQEGYDFYPPQSIQPFAVIDTLLRLGLVRPGDLQVTTFDVSPRVNQHLARTRRIGQNYTLQLPLDPQAKWKPDFVQYWERFGDQIGNPVKPAAVPARAGELKIRAVDVRPNITKRVTPADVNIVLQRLDLPPAEQFDLIVATNILVYYDLFEQSLAMLNIERMLRPGGLLLSNNALLELPFFRVRSVAYSTVVYSDRADDGDHIVWYQKTAN